MELDKKEPKCPVCLESGAYRYGNTWLCVNTKCKSYNNDYEGEEMKINPKNEDLARFFGLRLVEVDKWEKEKPKVFKALVSNFNKDFDNKKMPNSSNMPNMQDVARYFGFSRAMLYTKTFRQIRPRAFKALILSFINDYE